MRILSKRETNGFLDIKRISVLTRAAVWCIPSRSLEQMYYHDVTMTSKLLTGEENEVYGDSGYIGADKRGEALIWNNKGRKIKYKLNRKPSQIKKLSASGQYAAKKSEHKKSSIRAKVEHVFAVVKRQLGYRRTRYRGLEKQISKINFMFALANLILADRPCLAA